MQIIIISVKSFLASFKDTRELFFERLIRFIIYVGIFLVPIFFIPLGTRSWEFSKLLIFWGLLIIALIIWLGKVLVAKKIYWQFKFLDIAWIIFLVVYFIACLQGVNWYNSLLGINLNLAFSFVNLFFLGLYYLLLSRFIYKIKHLKIIFSVLIGSIFLLLLINFSQIISLPLGFLDIALSVNSYNFLLLIAFLLSLILWLIKKKKLAKIILFVLGFIFLSYLYLIDKQELLLILAVAIFVFILFLSLRSAYFSNRLVVFLTALLFLTILVLVIPVSSYLGIISPNELNLPLKYGWQITKSGLADHLLLGVGPQNFVNDFYLYKPLEYNNTNFWQLSFAKNSNFWLEMLTTAGLLGLGLWLLIFVLYFMNFIKYLKKITLLTDFAYRKIVVSSGLGVLIVAILLWAVFVNYDFVLLFLLVVFVSCGVGLMDKNKNQSPFINRPMINLFFYLSLVIILIAGYLISRLIINDLQLELIRQDDNKTLAEIEAGEKTMERLIRQNSGRYDYNLQYANLLIEKAVFLISNQEADDNNLINKINDNLNIVASQSGANINNYLALAQTVKVLKQLGLNVSGVSEEVNKKLLQFDPNNPDLYIDRALINFDKYLLMKADQTKEKEIKALSALVLADLNKALALKKDFVLAYYNLGLYYQEFGDEAKALENIKQAFTLAPGEKIIAQGLKKLYLNQDKVEEALDVLVLAVANNPEDIDLKIDLANVYLLNNEPIKAKEIAQQILALEPKNEEAKKILSHVK